MRKVTWQKSWRFAPRRWCNCSAVVRTGRRDRAETARWQDSLQELQQDVETEQQQLLVQCVAAVGRERSNSCSLECCVVTAVCQYELQQDVETEQQQLLVQCVAAVGRERSNSCSLQCCVVTADSQIAVGAEMLCWKGVELNRCFCYLENQILLSV